MGASLCGFNDGGRSVASAVLEDSGEEGLGEGVNSHWSEFGSRE